MHSRQDGLHHAACSAQNSSLGDSPGCVKAFQVCPMQVWSQGTEGCSAAWVLRSPLPILMAEPSAASCLAVHMEAREGPQLFRQPCKNPIASPEGRTNQAPGSLGFGCCSPHAASPRCSHPASCSTHCCLGRGLFGLPCPRLNWPGLPGLVICC